jgi:hypothetical protein
MDKHWQRFRDEVPDVKRPPSEYVRERFWFTTQPLEEPEKSGQLRSVIEWIGVERLLFSSDYPHWDYDDARSGFKTPLTDGERVQIFNANARAIYKLGGREIVVFHVNGQFFALLNRCPHAGAPLARAACVARLTSEEPGHYQRTRIGEMLRCALAWLGTRHAYKSILLRPPTPAGALLSRRGPPGRGPGQGALRRRNLCRHGRGEHVLVEI